ncbi:ABC transporter transmembrane region 2-domain-containing protein [Gorgonomyces haynaldii]|nr:ABC transporter transmembrane region 2-domain-containing protein [Gorgonomyces haynaldii]
MDKFKPLLKTGAAGLLVYVVTKRLWKPSKPEPEETGPIKIDKNVVKVGVDSRFVKQIKYILKLCIPSWRSKTILILVLHTTFLILRTYITVIGARLDGRIVKDLVAGDVKSFMRSLGLFMAISLPATYTNSMIKYLQSRLAVSLRTKLTEHVHDLYIQDNTFYKAINLDNRIDGADQLITTDINRFATALANLYSNLGKPILDIIIFNYQLARSIGLGGMWGLTLNYVVTASLLRAVTPPFGKLAAQEAKLEGDFRSSHSRVITNAEEIGFYNGENLEKSILQKTYNNLVRHINKIYRIRIVYNMVEDFLIKYSWSAVGLMLASIPVFFPDFAGSRSKREDAEIALAENTTAVTGETDPVVNKRTGSRTQGFITNKRLMLSLADAGGRIMYSYKELSELAGYTYRVYNMLRVFEDLKHNRFLETKTEKPYTLDKIEGVYKYNDKLISFQNVPVVTPFGDTVLVEDLNIKIGPGEHLMITGANGAGKTSILRVLAGLWPHFSGTITRPEPKLSSIMYIPQRPYLAIGTLRDQVIYPHTHEDMIKAGKTDADLDAILKIVYLDYIPAREGGYEAIKEWKDVFSGGEKQRVQLARMFYHKPRFCVLDEATSAVSTDVEALLYKSAKEQGITLVTISHRPTLFKYHPYLLRIGEGLNMKQWEFKQISSAKSLVESVGQEAKKIEKQLSEMDGLVKRLQVINKELSLNTNADDSLKNAKRTLV